MRRRPWVAFFHPEQGLWNVYSMAVARRLKLRRALIFLDTVCIWLKVLFRRIPVLSSVAPDPGSTRIRYFDIGLHSSALQAQTAIAWLARSGRLEAVCIEANPVHFESASKRLSDDLPDGVDLAVCNYAVVGPSYSDGTIKLYLDGKSGVGDSIYGEEGAEFFEVDARHLSKVIGDEAGASINIVRMNIEGGELGVLADLLDAGLERYIDGWFGTWDDMAAVSIGEAEEMRLRLKRASVRHLGFNDRDYCGGWLQSWRLAAIRFDVHTSVVRGAARVGSR